jgi:hypothetical protein
MSFEQEKIKGKRPDPGTIPKGYMPSKKKK